MSIKAAAPALIVAALALVADYSTSKQPGQSSTHENCASSPCLLNLRAIIAEITQGWLKLDALYAKNVATLMGSAAFDEAKYLKNTELLKAVRQLESDLKSADVPKALQGEHLGLRRAVAKVRTRMVTLDTVYKQFVTKPTEFESELDGTGLRDLADHTTRRLGHLA